MTSMTREDLNSINVNELGTKLQEVINEFKKEIAEINSTDELVLKESDLMDQMKVYEEYLKGVNYSLPQSVVFEGTTYTKSDIANKIVTFLNKMEVEFSYVTGLFQMSTLWRNPSMNQIDYYKYDSTLRTLGQIKYKGYKEWNDILAINNYMTSVNESYSRDTAYLLYLSHIHNEILDRMSALDKEKESETSEMVMEDENPKRKKLK